MSYSFQNKASSSAVTVGELNQVVNGVERPYKVYTALLTQSGTDAPVATVLENTLGNIVWTYDSTGVYNATLIGGFVENKSVLFKSTETSTNIKQIFYWGNENTLWFEQIDQTSAYIDGLYGEAIEIRVYN